MKKEIEAIKKFVSRFKKQKTDHPCSLGDTKENETATEKNKRKTISPTKDDENEVKSKKQRVSLNFPSVSGKVFVMGENNVGQLGFRLEIEERKRPTLLELPYSFTSIAAGGMHSVCLTENGEVITFGCNDEGALGRIAVIGDEVISPGRVEINERVIEISAGDSHSAALTDYGQVYLWGNFRNRNGTMGLTSEGVEQRRPIKILNDFQIVKISSGADHLACLSIDGIVYTCGCGQNGQLGRLTEQECHDGGQRGLAAFLEPAAVPVSVLIEDIWTSNDSTFLKAKGIGLIYAFGLNNYYQIEYSLGKRYLEVSITH